MFKDFDQIRPDARGAVERLANLSLIQGDDQGNFRPTDPIERQDFALVIDRLVLREHEVEELALQRIMQKIANSLVEVQTQSGLGSGVVVGPNHVITNWHVVDGSTKAELFWPSVYADPKLPKDFVGPMASVVATDPNRDLALLQFTAAGATPIEIGHEWAPVNINGLNSPQFIGRRVFIQGSPLGFSGRISDGIFNGIRGGRLDIDTHINPGNSGGPIVDRDGRMIGLVVAKWIDDETTLEGLGIGITLTDILTFLAQHGL